MSRLIDADALEEKAKRYSLGYYEADEWAVPLEAIDDAPTIDAVSVVHGKWIYAEIPLESGGSMPIQACSLCKTFYPLAYTGGGHRFCPNCGCAMTKE